MDVQSIVDSIISKKYPTYNSPSYFKHFAITFTAVSKKDLSKLNIITSGYNYGTNFLPTHAEYDAIRKLKPIIKKNRLKKINLLVVRFNKNYGLLMSRPCKMCTRMLTRLPQKSGYIIDKVYYSGTNGVIIETTIDELNKCDELCRSHYYSHRSENFNQ